jgi:hypothetical protein
MVEARVGEEEETYQIEHNLTQQHILQALQSTLVALTRLILESLEEIRVRSFIILILGMQYPALEIKLGLQIRRTINRVSSRLRARQSRA